MKFFSGLLLLIGAVALSVVADVFLKKSQFQNWKLVMLGFFLYGLEAIPVAIAFQKITFGPVMIIWSAVAVTLGVLVASILFKEPLTYPKMLALIFAVVAIYLSNRS